jgi:transposase
LRSRAAAWHAIRSREVRPAADSNGAASRAPSSGSARTGTINALRGHLAEHGVVAAVLRGGLNQLFAVVEAEEDQGPTAAMKELLRLLVEEIRAADARIAVLDRKLKDGAKEDEACRRLIEVPGMMGGGYY